VACTPRQTKTVAICHAGGDKQFGHSAAYDLVADDEGEPPLPPPPPRAPDAAHAAAQQLPPPPPAGRGAGAVQPAWMTHGSEPAAPGRPDGTSY